MTVTLSLRLMFMYCIFIVFTKSIVMIVFSRLATDYKFRLGWLQSIIYGRAQRYILLVASLIARVKGNSALDSRKNKNFYEFFAKGVNRDINIGFLSYYLSLFYIQKSY